MSVCGGVFRGTIVCVHDLLGVKFPKCLHHHLVLSNVKIPHHQPAYHCTYLYGFEFTGHGWYLWRAINRFPFLPLMICWTPCLGACHECFDQINLAQTKNMRPIQESNGVICGDTCTPYQPAKLRIPKTTQNISGSWLLLHLVISRLANIQSCFNIPRHRAPETCEA